MTRSIAAGPLGRAGDDRKEDRMGIVGISHALTLWALKYFSPDPGSFRPSEGRRDCRREESPQRGDVPGWVMITLMSAVLVAALLALAGPALEALFNQAMTTVGQ